MPPKLGKKTPGPVDLSTLQFGDYYFDLQLMRTTQLFPLLLFCLKNSCTADRLRTVTCNLYHLTVVLKKKKKKVLEPSDQHKSRHVWI